MKAISSESSAEGPETFITTYGVMINIPNGIVRIEAVIHIIRCMTAKSFEKN